MQRREFIIFGGAAVAWPLAVYAQQGERVRRVGVLTGTSERDPEAQARHAAFVEGLQELGWVEGRNLRIHARWTAGDGTVTQKYAVELVELAPDVILVGGGSSIGAVLQA